MKRRLSLLLAVVMVLGSFSFAFAANDEVDPGKFLEQNGVLKGDTTGDLMLDKPLERRDSVILLSRLLGVEKEAKAFEEEGLPTWEDNNDGNYKGYLAWAQSNKYFQGHSEAKFGPRETITVKEYAVVLLRALGYYDEAADWKAVFETAKKLGVLEEVKKEADEEVLRGDAAQMTFNALGLKVKGEDKTLAEKLGIEMPAPKELKVEKVYTENLAEVIVELSNAKLADKEKLEDVNNYKLTGFVVKKATVDGNNVIVLLNDGLAKDKKYELVVRNIDKAINKTYKFTAEDNTIPAIENVEALGKYGIKVTTSEPIADPQERSFLVDGKNIAMDLEQYGRVIILTPYHDTAFPENAKTLTVKPLADYAGFKSIEKDFEIEITKDEVAPEVTDVVIKGNVVEVTFDKDIYADSVEGYSNRNRTGNVSYKDGRQTIYTVQYGGEKVDVNKARYEFDREIPRRSEITIEGVANHSDVAMKSVTTEGRIVTDYSEPALIDNKKSDYVRGENGKSGLTITLYFDKDVSGKILDDNKDDAKLTFDADYHFDIYENDVVRNRRLEGKPSDYIKSVKYGLDKNDKVRKDVIVLEVTGLNVNNTNKDFDYVLEVRDFTDVTSFKNRMYRDYVDFNIPKASPAFKVTAVKMVEGKLDTDITITFNLPVDRVKAENLSNYLIIKENGAKSDIEDLEGKIVVDKSGYDVTLTLPEFDSSKYETLRVLETLKDVWYGNRLGGQTDFRLVDLKGDGVNMAANEVSAKINALPAVADLKLEDKATVEAARKAYDDLKNDEKKFVSETTLQKLVDAEAQIKVLEENSQKGEKETAAVNAINEANVYTMDSAITANAKTLGLDLTTFNTLKNKATVYEALAGKNFENAAAVKTAFDNAVEAQKAAEEAPVSDDKLAFEVLDVDNQIQGVSIITVTLKNIPEGKTAENYKVTIDGVEAKYANGKFAAGIKKVVTKEQAEALVIVEEK